ncbi:hypothetical protein [Deinococcus radiotolerans]|uniref:Aminoglycoside phosphotransferase domain-containing protein n=1 Tax=Deinococcus radiotolerans TaxID=1309407 RepID=A0ABQ2FPT0_9DEIO|nr:hypothetical protein [Deinococcus radiotolerans]GGL14852.1 hypothetical protein GCM10010844_37120 [Deinococcus radiotolerans]
MTPALSTDQAMTHWAAQQLLTLNRTPLPNPEVIHERPWSTVWRFDTAGGAAFLKRTVPVFAHEVPLTAFLAAQFPGQVPGVLGSDPERRALLLEDAGTALRHAHPADADGGAALLRAWEGIWPQLAELQLACAAHVQTLLAVGVPDRRPGTLAARFGTLLADRAALLVDQPDSLTAQDVERAHTLLPRLNALAAELDAFGLPHTLHHDDFHDGNVFMRGGAARLADWAESAVTSPLCTLTVGLRGLQYRLNLPDGDPRLTRVTDAYLEPFRVRLGGTDLRRAADLAQRVGRALRALTWADALRDLPLEVRAAEADAVPGWVGLWLDGMDEARPVGNLA